MRQQRLFLQFFKRLGRIVVIHGSLPKSRGPMKTRELNNSFYAKYAA
jgi:hypothetical protein